MKLRLAYLLGTSLAVLLGGVDKTRAQDLPSTPVPLTPGSQTPGGTGNQPQLLPAPTAAGSPLMLPPPPPLGLTPPLVAPYQDHNGPLLRGDPLLERSPAPPGLFAGLELDVLAPHIRNRLVGSVAVDGFEPDTIHLPTAGLDWAGSPRLELGYRFPEGLGEVLVSYKFLVTDGTRRLVFVDGDGNSTDGFLKSRLNLNSVDIDYGSREFSLEPCWDMAWRVGVRIAEVFFDSRAAASFFEQRESNQFVGAGPHVALDLTRRLDWPGWSFFGRIEGAAVIGQIHQAFNEGFVIPDEGALGGASDIRHTQAVPVLALQLGLTWMPGWNHYPGRFTFGYQFEQWWDIGRAGPSNANLTDQGLFFRGGWNF